MTIQQALSSNSEETDENVLPALRCVFITLHSPTQLRQNIFFYEYINVCLFKASKGMH